MTVKRGLAPLKVKPLLMLRELTRRRSCMSPVMKDAVGSHLSAVSLG